MNPSESLAALRNAAESGDWNGCKKATMALGRLISPRQLIGIACAEMRRRLPAFLRSQPRVTWPDQILARLEAGEAPELAILRIEEYPGPGANNYHTALEMLMEAARYRDDDEAKSIERSVDAIAGAIMAALAENWGSRSRERWNLWYEATASDPSSVDENVVGTLVDMSRDPEIVAMKRQSWMDVAGVFERVRGA